ncbi:MAG: glutamate synthase-related protein, partial [Pseudomonadota bacterium]
MMALGADWCNAGRGFMMALGCIQAQSCHTGKCPTGVTTQDPVRQQALVVPDKAERVRSFHRSTLHALQELVQAAGLQHPQEVNAHHIVRRLTDTEVRLLSNLIIQMTPGALLDAPEKQATVFRYYWPLASAHSFRANSAAMQGPIGPGIDLTRDSTELAEQS